MNLFDALIRWLCESGVDTPEIVQMAKSDLGSVDEQTRAALEALIEEYNAHLIAE